MSNRQSAVLWAEVAILFVILAFADLPPLARRAFFVSLGFMLGLFLNWPYAEGN